jgi:hypothetical protein
MRNFEFDIHSALVPVARRPEGQGRRAHAARLAASWQFQFWLAAHHVIFFARHDKVLATWHLPVSGIANLSAAQATFVQYCQRTALRYVLLRSII